MSRRALLAVTALVLAALASFAPPARAQSPAPLARDQILVLGLGLEAAPAYQAWPKNIATGVTTLLVGPPGTTSDLPALPPDSVVLGELRGPAIATSITLVARPNEPLVVPPLALAGLYTVEHIRLVSGGETLLEAEPAAVTIEVIDEILVSQVSSRALSAAEIRERGIVIDEENFQVVNFTAAFGIEGRQVTIDFPMVVPVATGASAAVALPALGFPALGSATTVTESRIPELELAFQTPNVGVSGLLLKVEADNEDLRGFAIPALSGLIVIPGNVAYLNQFFSVMLLVANAAPGASSLVVRDVVAKITLPGGTDTVLGTGDDPLRMAMLGSPPAPQASELPICVRGPDGDLGTDDDECEALAPTQSGESEFLVEGRREGTHIVEIEISGMLDGLPLGHPVRVSGKALGVVEVRDPSFALTLSHPATVTAGEEYDLLVTVTNTSEITANFVSVNLLPRSISGARLVSPGTQEVETIAAGESATVGFRLLSQQTGNVVASSFTADDLPGRFELSTAVGSLGIPLSPNTLVLPAATGSLPQALRDSAVGFLGQALALATAPVLPRGLDPLGRAIVTQRATELAQAGQRVGYGEPLSSAVRDLLLDFAGHGFARIDERFASETARAIAARDFRGFDTLLRRSERGAALLDLMADAIAPELEALGAAAFAQAWAEASASRPPQVMALASASGAAPPLRITDPGGAALGSASVGEEPAREIAFGAWLSLAPDARMALATAPAPGAWQVELEGTGSPLDLALVVPGPTGLRLLVWEGVALAPGARARVVFTLGMAGDYALALDTDANGVPESLLAPSLDDAVEDTGPSLVSATQVSSLVGVVSPLVRFGQVIALVFSEEISEASSQSGLPSDELANYSVEANQVLAAALQPGGRVVLLALRDPVGPLVPRSVTVSSTQDRFGHPQQPSPATLEITPAIESPGGRVAGVVRRADGTPVPRAQVRLAFTEIGEGETTICVKSAHDDGSYGFDFVPAGGGLRLEAIDPVTGERGETRTQIRFDSQALDLDLILLGAGNVAGRALAPNGTPLAGAVVVLTSLTRFGDRFGAVTDDAGGFVLSGVPVGAFTLEAAHVPTRSRVVSSSVLPGPGQTLVVDLELLPLADPGNPTGTLRGQVFRADGRTPAPGIPVYTTRGGYTETDASGSYRIEGVPAGELQVRAIDQALLESGTAATEVVANLEITANVLLFGGVGVVRGVVVSPDGFPVADALVGGGLSLVRSDANGAFVMADVPVGARTLTARDDLNGLFGRASVNLAGPGDESFVRIVLEGRGTLTGRVFEADDDRTPVAGLTVYVLGPINLAGVTDASGAYRFEGLPLGPYLVSAFRPDFGDGNTASAKLVFHRETVRADVTFRGRGNVRVHVLNESGNPLGGAFIGLSELEVNDALLRPPENTNCFGDIQVGDVTVELPQCSSVGIGFRLARLTRTESTPPTSGELVFTGVFVGGFTIEVGNRFTGEVISASGEIPAPGQTVDVTLQFMENAREVTGTVFRPDGATPVGAGALVLLKGSGPDLEARTDADGRFLFQFPFISGPFMLVAEDSVTGLTGQTSATVARGATADVPIRLLGRGSVTIDVVGSGGAVEGAQVVLQRGTFPSDRHVAETNPAGRVVFADGDAVSEGPFGVSVFVPGSGAQASAGGEVPRPGGPTNVVVEVSDAAGSVVGRFLRSAGAIPIPNAQIRLSSVRGDNFTTTDSNGAFAFDGVAVGPVTIEGFDPATARRGHASGVVAAHLQQLTIDIVELAQGTVVGVVLLSKERAPVAGADVTLNVQSIFGQSLRTTSDVDGSFRFPGVSAGSFSVSASDAAGHGGSASGVIATEGEGVSVEVVLAVPPVGRIEGLVTRANGDPATSVQVTLGGRQTSVDAAGFYFFDDVPVGTHALRATEQLGPDLAGASATVAFDGDIARADLRFIGTGSVRGTVRDAGGTAVVSAVISLSARSSLGTLVSATTLSGVGGEFEFARVAVGEASVTATEAGTLLSGSASGAIESDGDVLQLELTLEPAGAIGARVLRESDLTPAAGMAVELVGGGIRRFAATAADGSFSFQDLAIRDYALIIDDPLGDGRVRFVVADLEAGQTRALGDLVLDESAPQVLAVDPSDGAANASPATDIRVLFSEPMDAATVSGATLVVATAAGVVPGTWTLAADGASASFRPLVAFADFARVGVRVTTGVRDLVDRALTQDVLSAFTTADSTSPVIMSRSPAADARNVPVESVVRVAFSERIDPASAALVLSRGGVSVAGARQTILSDTVALFLPAAPLAPNARYDVALAPARDVFGNETPGASWSFDTLDTQAPVVTALVAAGGTSVLEGATAQIAADVGDASDVAFVEFLVNGALAGSDASAPFELALPIRANLGAGPTVAARATDQAGNVGPFASLSLTVSVSLPAVSIDAPAGGSAVGAGASFAVDVSASDALGIAQIVLQASGAVSSTQTRVLASGTTSTSQRFDVAVPANAAPNAEIVLRAVAVNASGNAADAGPVTLTVVDVSRPLVEITSPAPASDVLAGESVHVTVRASDNSSLASLSLRASGAASFSQSVTPAPGSTVFEASFDVPIPATATGAQTLVLTAEAVDSAGLVAVPVTRVLPVRDTLAPNVTIEILGGIGEIAAGGSVPIRVSATDEVAVLRLAFESNGVSFAGVAVSPARSPASADFEVPVPETALEGSAINIAGTAQDAAGNLGRSATVSVTVRSDVTPPSVALADLTGSPLLTVGASDVAIVIDATSAAATSFAADVDGDGTPDSVLEAEIAAAKRLLALLDPATTQVVVVKYGDVAQLESSLDSDFESAEIALDEILVAGPAGSASVESALSEATDALVDQAARRDALPRVFLFSRGTGSTPGAELTRASEGGIVVNTFAVGAGAGSNLLGQVALATGGTFRAVTTLASIETAFSGTALAGSTRLPLVANVEDDGVIASVRFVARSADGSFEQTIVDDEAPFAVAFALPLVTAPLEFDVRATARDAAGNEGTSPPLALTLVPPDTTPVIVRLVPSSAFTGDSIEIVGRFFDPIAEQGSVEFTGAAAEPSEASKIRLRVEVPAGATTGPLFVRTADLESNEVEFTQLAGRRFEAGADYSSTSNPNGVWSYGAGETPGAFSAYTQSLPHGPLTSWQFAPGVPPGSGAPGVYHNSSGAPLFYIFEWTPNRLGAHPGPTNSRSVIRFTAPELATIRIDVAFVAADVATADVHVLRSGVELFAGIVSGQGDTETFSRAVRVVAGDTIDFAVGADGAFYSDQTFVDAAILLAAPGGPDGDGDGLSNDEEALVGTSPGSPDSDGDGLLDGDEFVARGTDPLRTDTDGDGLSDGFEVLNGLNPLSSASPGAHFDAAADFSSSENPNGPWSFGAAATLGAFSAYASHDQASGLDRWHLAPGVPESLGAPGTLWNGSGADVFVPYRWPAGRLGSHPGPNGEFGIVRFTAPELATIRIDAAFEGGDVATTDVHVLHDGVELFAGIISGRGDVETFSRALRVAAGDTIDFAVGANGSFFSDLTFVDAAILLAVPGGPDADADGLSNDEEALVGTSPTDPDSDEDGLPDGEEFATRGTDPLRTDTDGDLLSDGAEVLTHGTDPLRADTDGDGLNDRYELLNGLNPLATDSDADGLGDGVELARGLAPTRADTDSDGLCDGGVTLPSVCPLGGEDLDGDGALDAGETSPTAIDSDGDGYSDGHERADGSDPRDAASVPTAGKLWTGAVDTVWSNADNWSPAGAPVLQSSVTIPGSTLRQPALVANAQVGRLTLLSGARLEIAGFTLQAGGEVSVATGAEIAGTGLLSLSGTNVGLRGLLPAVTVLAAARVRITGETTVRGNLATTGGPVSAVLDLNGQTLGVTGDFLIIGHNVLTMQNASGVLDVAGSVALVSSSSISAGSLTAGTLRVGRHLYASTYGAFVATGSHTVVLTGASPLQDLGSYPLEFANLRLETGQMRMLGYVRVNGLFSAARGSAVVGASEFMDLNGGIDAAGVNFYGARVIIRGGPISLDDAAFRSYAPTATPLRFNVEALDVTLSNLTFDTVPTSGFYIAGFDTDGPATLARLRIVGSSPRHGLPKTDVLDGFLIEWGTPADDTDGDGLTDAVEFTNGFDPRDPADAARDDDGDGLTNVQEIALGTDRFAFDSDFDGFSDGDEVNSGGDPTDGASFPGVDLLWLGGDGADPAGWSNPANWSPFGVPTAATSVLVPASAAFMPQVTAGSEVGALWVGIGASLTLVNSELRSFGDVKADGMIVRDGPAALLELAGTGVVVRGTIGAYLRVTGQARISPLAARALQCGSGALCVYGGSLIVSGAGADLDVGPLGGTVVEDLFIEPGATLTMREPGDLSVEGSAYFNGASTEGRLTDGTLRVFGGLNAVGEPQSFAASGTHVAWVQPTVFMSDPGPDTQHFQDLSIQSSIDMITDVQVNGIFSTCGECGETIFGYGHTLTTAIARVVAARFSEVALLVENGAESYLWGVDFENANPTATQLTVRGANPDTQLDGLHFQTRPTTGLYLAIEGEGEITVTNSSPLHGTPKASAAPGVTLLWGDPADDTDADGLSDADELAHPCADPLNPDSDFDGLLDGEDAEICLSIAP